MRGKNDRRPLKRQELRYVLFHKDQYQNAPDKLKKDAVLHIGRVLAKPNAVIVACSGEAELDHWQSYDAYPYFQWFRDCGAPICGKCKRIVLKDIEENGLDD